MLELRVRSSTEVFGIFSPLIPPGARRAALDAAGKEAKWMRQGLVPDLSMELPAGLASDADAALRTQLGEVKVIHHNPTRYIASDSDPGNFGAAVRRRATPRLLKL